MGEKNGIEILDPNFIKKAKKTHLIRDRILYRHTVNKLRVFSINSATITKISSLLINIMGDFFTKVTREH